MTVYLNFSTKNNYLDSTIENYLIYGLDPGSFATALLAGDLFLAAAKADHWNAVNLADIAKILYFNMPAGSIGSYDIVDAWIADKDNCRSVYARRMEKEYTFNVLKGNISTKHASNIFDPPF
jgi:hypothetical protein